MTEKYHYEVKKVRRCRFGYSAVLYAGGVQQGKLFRAGTRKECENYWSAMVKRMNDDYTKQIGWRNPFSGVAG